MFYFVLTSVSDSNQLDILKRKTTDDDSGTPKRQKTDDVFLAERPRSVGPSTCNRSFVPLYLMSNWQESLTTVKRLSVAIVLPSGIQGFKIKVVEEGDCLELVIDWPLPLTDTSMLHRKWLEFGDGSLTEVHPKVLGFQSALKSLREKCNDNVQSVAHIGLPFTVESHIDQKHKIGWREDSTRIVYIDLKALVDDYAAVNDTMDFDIV